MLICLQSIDSEEEQSKFEEIYKTYHNLMYQVAFALLRQEQDAEDAVHHVFVKIAQNIQKIEPVCPRTKQYVVTMVENRAIDVLRARGRHPEFSYEDAMENSLSSQPEGEDLLAQCILRLPERQRMVIWLKYYHGYSLREIAKMLDMTLPAVQKTDQRAKKKLEELYLAEGGTLS